MLDYLFVDDSYGVKPEINPPQKAGEILKPEKPWEEYRISPEAIIEDNGVYRMWYSAFGSYDGVDGMVACPRCELQNEGRKVVCRKCGWPLGDPDIIFSDMQNICYAESIDGICWERQNLELVNYKGSCRNNIAQKGGAIAINPVGSENERYMCLGEREKKIWIYTSRDGLKWERKPNPVLPFSADTNNQIMYDNVLGKYVAFLRGFPGRRTTVRCEFSSLDEAPWPYEDHGHTAGDNTGTVYLTDELETVMDIDKDDPELPGLDINGINACIYADGVYLGFPTFFRKYPPSGLDKKGREAHRFFSQGNDGTFEVQLAVSRDGRKWYRYDRRPYLSCGIYGGADGGLVSVAPGLIKRGNEVYQYYCGKRTTHGIFEPGYDKKEGSIFRLVQLKDRFIGMTASHSKGGWFITPPVIHTGSELILNIDCRGLGEASIQITNEDGVPIEGFAHADCDRVDLNHLEHKVTWRGNSDVSTLANRPVRLDFKMQMSTLYTFGFK